MEFISKWFSELTSNELYEILKSRAKIFLIEQKIHYLDMDDVDKESLHCFFYENEKVIAYLRAFFNDKNTEEVKIGRVLTLEHKKGNGTKLLTQSIKVIKEKMNCKKIIIDSQKHAVDFYKKFGFSTISDDFLEEGIVHQKMELNL